MAQKFYKEFNIMASLRSVNIKIHNLDGNLLYITMILSMKLAFCKINIRQLFIQMI